MASALIEMARRVVEGRQRDIDALIDASRHADHSDIDAVFAWFVDHDHLSLPAVRDAIVGVLDSQSWLAAAAYRVLLRRSEVDEVVQETLLVVSQQLGEFRGDAKLRTWVTSIVRNLAIGVLRRRRETPAGDRFELFEDAPSVRFSSQLAQRCDLERLLDALPAEFAQTVRLRDLERLSYAEIADATGVGMNTVRSRLARGRARLADLYQPDPIDDKGRRR